MIDIASHSIQGKREEQQDCLLIYPHRVGVYAAVFDGMGGMEDGAAASHIASGTLQALWQEKAPSQQPPVFFLESIDILDESVTRLKNGSGTTIAAVMIEENRLHWLGVGDSRIYLLRGEEIVRATRDHNAAMLPDTPPEKREALISFLGLAGIDVMDLNKTSFLLEPGDIVLICSDGVYKALADTQIHAAVFGKNAQAGIAELFRQIETANHPKQDNATAIILQYT